MGSEKAMPFMTVKGKRCVSGDDTNTWAEFFLLLLLEGIS